MTITFEEIKYFNSLPTLLSKGSYDFVQYETNFQLLDYVINNIEFFSKLKFVLENTGYCVVNLDTNISALEFSKLCTTILGDLLPQTSEALSLYYNVEYNPEKIKSTYQLNSNKAQPLHTDGHYNSIVPKFIALNCEIQSEFGGYSQLISASNIYDYIKSLNPNVIPKLFDVDSIQYIRKSPNGNGVFKYKKPLLINQENRKIGIHYNPIMYEINSTKKVEDSLRLVNYYTNNPKNQIVFKLKPNQILIVDNQLYLHGRSCFSQNSIRKMQRFWFKGI